GKWPLRHINHAQLTLPERSHICFGGIAIVENVMSNKIGRECDCLDGFSVVRGGWIYINDCNALLPRLPRYWTLISLECVGWLALIIEHRENFCISDAWPRKTGTDERGNCADVLHCILPCA